MQRRIAICQSFGQSPTIIGDHHYPHHENCPPEGHAWFILEKRPPDEVEPEPFETHQHDNPRSWPR